MRTASIVVGLGFGDEGKGSIVDALAFDIQQWSDQSITVVRYNGGSQAAHNVITDTGLHHTFSQFGAATFQRARTHLSRFMLVSPFNMNNEREHLKQLGRIIWSPPMELRPSVDPRALIITPLHQAANRLRELARGADRHGSCGEGIGETVSYALSHPDALRVGHFKRFDDTIERLHALRDFLVADLAGTDGEETEPLWAILRSSEGALVRYTLEYLAWRDSVELVKDEDALNAAEHVIFEGAQGILLDENFRFSPHVTWSNTTTANAFELMREVDFDGPQLSLGVTRTYATRHGPGPLPSEYPIFAPEPHNDNGFWQGRFRCGLLDVELLREAVAYDAAAGGHIDALAITWRDAPDNANKWFMRTTDGDFPYDTYGFCDWMDLPLAVESYGPKALDKFWTRHVPYVPRESPRIAQVK